MKVAEKTSVCRQGLRPEPADQEVDLRRYVPVRTLPPRRLGRLSRARAVAVMPLHSCGYGKEQRSAVTATAWQPLSPEVAGLQVCAPETPSRAPAGRGKLITSAFAQVSGLSSDRQSAEVLFEKHVLSSAPSRIRTCAHGSGGSWLLTFLPAQTVVRKVVGPPLVRSRHDLLLRRTFQRAPDLLLPRSQLVLVLRECPSEPLNLRRFWHGSGTLAPRLIVGSVSRRS